MVEEYQTEKVTVVHLMGYSQASGVKLVDFKSEQIEVRGSGNCWSPVVAQRRDPAVFVSLREGLDLSTNCYTYDVLKGEDRLLRQYFCDVPNLEDFISRLEQNRGKRMLYLPIDYGPRAFEDVALVPPRGDIVLAGNEKDPEELRTLKAMFNSLPYKQRPVIQYLCDDREYQINSRTAFHDVKPELFELLVRFCWAQQYKLPINSGSSS